MVRPTLQSLIGLTGGSDVTIWVDAKKVAGPFPPVPHMVPYGYRSSLKLMGYRQHLKESEAQVAAMLEEARSA